MKRFTGKKEDVYSLVLALVGVILGWAAVKTRDLEGTLALVKWGLVIGFIAVAVTLVPLSLARLLWERKPESGTTPYYLQTKPAGRLTDLPDLSPISARSAEFRLLFPPGTRETPPPEEFAASYDATLGKLLKADGIPYFTDDPAVKAFRGELFRALAQDPELSAILRRFADRYPVNTAPDSLRQSLTDCRARYDAVRTLREELNRTDPLPDALRGLRDHLNRQADSEEGRTAETAFSRLPEDLFSIRSVTLAVNLDSGGHAHEAGIVALYGEPFGRDTGEPLVHPDRERYDLTLELNRELMGCVDRVLAEELRRMGTRLDALRRAMISDTLVREIRFAAELQEKVRGLAYDPETAAILSVFLGDEKLPENTA